MKFNLQNVKTKLFTFLVLVCAILLSSYDGEAAYSVTGETFSISSPATVNANEHVNITFNYTKDGVGGVYIYAQPYYNGVYAASGAYSPSGLYANASGSGNGFITLSNAGSINQIRFRIYASDNTTLLYEKDTYVDYKFVNYNVTNISVSPISGSTLATTQKVNISLNYFAKDGNVRIYAQPFYNGVYASGGAYSPSPLSVNASGVVNSFITLNSAGTVNQIKILIYASDNTTLLFTKVLAVNYKFIDFDILNVVFNPTTNKTLTSGEKVNLTFDYKSKQTDVRIYAQPYYNGSYASGGSYQPSGLYSTNVGSGTGSFSLSNGGIVNQVKFLVYASDNTTLLYEEVVAVNYTFINFDIASAIFSPASNVTVTTNDKVNLTFTYRSKQNDVRIYAQPFYNGSYATGGAYSPSPLYSSFNGSGTGFFTLSNPGTVNQVKFFFYASDNTTLLYEEIVNVRYTFANYAISNVVFTPSSPDTLTTGTRVNLTFSYNAIGGNVYTYAMPYNGTSMPSGASYSPSALNAATSGNKTGFFSLSTPGKVTAVRFKIYASDNTTLLYEKIVAVNYTFTSPALRQAALIPVSDEIESVEEIVAYPVPAVDKLTVKYAKASSFTYQLLSVNGETVSEGQGENNEAILNVEPLEAGVYIVKIMDGSEVVQKKVVITK